MSESQLPSTWETCVLSDVGEINSGGTPSTKNPEFWGDDIPWISPSDLTGYKAKYIVRGAKSLSRKGLAKSSAKILPAGSIHFSSRAPIGYVAISSQSLCTNQGFKSLSPADGVFNEYVYFYLKSIKDLANSLATGTTFKELSGTAFAKLPLPLPPLAEQKRIVSKIEELFSELDAGEESLRRARRQLGVYRQALLKQAFEGKLTEHWRKQRTKQAEWRTVTLESISDDISYGYTASSTQEKVGPRLLRITDIQDNRVNWDEVPFCLIEQDRKLHYLLKAGDLVFARTGATVGKSFLLKDTPPESVFASYLIRVRCQPGNSMEYLALFFQSHIYWSQITEFSAGIGQPNVNGSKLKKLKVPLCSLPEQQEIVRLLDEQFTVIEQNEREIEAALKRSAALRQSILKKAFTGQLVPQDPNDEPASALLDRIRKERETGAVGKSTRKSAKPA